MADAELIARGKTLLDQLSDRPRFAGSPEEATARAKCRGELERAGFSCRELPFEYSQWPGRWGPPIAAASQATTIIVIAHMSLHHDALEALWVGAALFCALFCVSRDAKRRWVTRFPWQRASSVNLEARRGTPEVWLVAHLDSKSQTVPMLPRIASSVALTLVNAAALLVVVLSLAGVGPSSVMWLGIEVGAVLAALPSMLCFVGNDSPGAVDNASGVAAVLSACQSVSAPQGLGVLITSGEELGLAGARVWAGQGEGEGEAKPGFSVINCDTVDDAGNWRCMYTGAKPRRITAAAETISGKLGLNLVVGRLIPGILADSMAFADRGIESVTVSRGTLSTLARIHTRGDNSTALSGTGVAEAGALVSALAKELS